MLRTIIAAIAASQSPATPAPAYDARSATSLRFEKSQAESRAESIVYEIERAEKIEKFAAAVSKLMADLDLETIQTLANAGTVTLGLTVSLGSYVTHAEVAGQDGSTYKSLKRS